MNRNRSAHATRQRTDERHTGFGRAPPGRRGQRTVAGAAVVWSTPVVVLVAMVAPVAVGAAVATAATAVVARAAASHRRVAEPGRSTPSRERTATAPPPSAD